MCGIVGLYNPNKWNLFSADYIMPEMLTHNQIRGRDAVGLFMQTRSGDMDFCKQNSNVETFMEWDVPNRRFFKVAESARFMVGHNRAATVGGIGADAAHPHVIDKTIYLVHNGTLRGQWQDEGNKHVSDSHAIANWLHQEPDFRKVAGKIIGAYALVWYDRRDDSLNFVRNFERPLGFVESNDGAMWFGSETDMIVWLLRRRNRDVKNIWQLEPHHWVKIHPDHRKEVIKVPFVYREEEEKQSFLINSEEFFLSEEAKRAFETLKNPIKTATSFDDSEVDAAEEEVRRFSPKHQRSLYDGRRDGSRGSWSSTGSTTGTATPATSSTDKVLPLKKWAGLEKGAWIYFMPINFDLTGTQKDHVVANGVFMNFNETGEPEFIDGVEIRARLSEEVEREGKRDLDFFIAQLMDSGVPFGAEIASIVYNRETRRIRIYCTRACPQDWWEWDWYPYIGAHDAELAWCNPYVWPTAPEPATTGSKEAATEKK